MIGKKQEIIEWLYSDDYDELYEIKKYKKGRSLNANAYAWKLCNEIASSLGTTKEEIYKKVIREVGEFELIPVRKEAVSKFVKIWQSRGLGWICEVNQSKLKNFLNITAYYGSSVYDTKQMSRLINSLVEEAKMLGILTLDDLEINKLLEEYEKEQRKQQ